MTDKLKVLDWAGAFTITSANVLVLMGLTFGGQIAYGWSSAATISCLAIGVAIYPFFFWAEMRAKLPMIPIGLFKIRNFSIIQISSFVLGISAFGPTYFVPTCEFSCESGARLRPLLRDSTLFSSNLFVSICANTLYALDAWLSFFHNRVPNHPRLLGHQLGSRLPSRFRYFYCRRLRYRYPYNQDRYCASILPCWFCDLGFGHGT